MGAGFVLRTGPGQGDVAVGDVDGLRRARDGGDLVRGEGALLGAGEVVVDLEKSRVICYWLQLLQVSTI